MEWSKDRTLRLVELLQVNASLWNPSLCDTRRDKQKRKEELKLISDILGMTIPDVTKKIQHLRTQYNRESAREARVNAEEPNERYISNWYAFECLHFMKDSSKPYTVLHSDIHTESNNCITQINDSGINACKLENLSPPQKIPRTDSVAIKPELIFSTSPKQNRDEFSVFGEYVANELRSLKGERNLLVAKKKIQDAIFEVKMGLINDSRKDSICTVYTHTNQASALHNGKIYTTPALSTSAHIEPLPTAPPPTSGMNEIIINSACHYSNFKVDNQ